LPEVIECDLSWGQGQYAKVGIIMFSVDRMGLMQKPKVIVARCQTDVPDFLGLTVLQLDTDDDLEFVGRSIPETTCQIAGGAAFRLDPELDVRCRVDYVAKNVAHFIHFILDWSIKDR
jgi:hypothetical protein